MAIGQTCVFHSRRTACDGCVRSDQACPQLSLCGSSRPRLVSVSVSFTPGRRRPLVVAEIVFAQLADGDGR